ncbi:MAG: FHA domain-containing protein, partial [Planctomycetota bacterium]
MAESESPFTDLRTLADYARAVGREHFLQEFDHAWLVRVGTTQTFQKPEQPYDPMRDTLPTQQSRINMFVGGGAELWPVDPADADAQGRVALGRELSNQIVLANPSVSKRHACFVFGDSMVKLVDLGSSNGTIADGRRLEPEKPFALGDHHSLRFGGAVSLLYCGSANLWALMDSGAVGRK